METPLQGQDGAHVQLVNCMSCSCAASSCDSCSSKLELLGCKPGSIMRCCSHMANHLRGT